MPELRLHLDADTSIKALHRALLERKHDVTRTPTAWMPLDAPDEIQLLGATAQGRCIFTFNARDFVPLSQRLSRHAGIVLAYQPSWTLSELIGALDRFLTEGPEMQGLVAWLNAWR